MPVPPEIARFLAALDKTQYLAPERLRAYQRRLLDRLLRHAQAETAFYADRLAPVFRADDSIDWDRWTDIPILTRIEAQANEAALTARTLPKAAGRAIPSTTSGSTGRPFRHFNTDMQNIASACGNERFFTWHGLDPAALAATIRDIDDPEAVYPNGSARSGWRLGHDDSRIVALSVGSPVAQQVEWLRRMRPATLSTFPSNLREIGRIAAKDGAPLSFAALITMGETLTPSLKAEIGGYFGRQPLDHYGSTEIGHIAASCPHTLKHHVSAEMALIEIVGGDDAPVAPGTVGRIVATSFYNYATPMIRYDMGDHGVLSPEPCGCGRTLPVFERILGRSRNVFRFSDGSTLWPVLESKEVQPFVPHRQFQVVQVAPDLVEYRYVPVAPDQRNDPEGLTALARARLHPAVTIEAVAVEAIARSPSGKYEDYVSLVDATPAAGIQMIPSQKPSSGGKPSGQ